MVYRYYSKKCRCEVVLCYGLLWWVICLFGNFWFGISIFDSVKLEFMEKKEILFLKTWTNESFYSGRSTWWSISKFWWSTWFHVSSDGAVEKIDFRVHIALSLCNYIVAPVLEILLSGYYIYLVVEGAMKLCMSRMQLLHAMRCMLSCKIEFILMFWSSVSSLHKYPLGDLVKRLGPVGAMT